MNVAGIVDVVISEIGLGKWQCLYLITACLSQSVGPVQQLGSPLLSAPLPFRCSYPGHDNQISDEDNYEYPSTCLSNIAPGKSIESVVLRNISRLNRKSTGLASCPEIEYDTSIFQSTVIEEWDLVCESSYLRPLFQMTYAIGAILGSTFCGQLSDWLGRKRSLQIGSVFTLTTILVTSVVPWYSVMITMRILTGIGTILMLFPAYTIVSEVCPPKSRALPSILIGLVYFLALTALAGIAYGMPHWRKILVLCNTPLLLLVPFTFKMNESPRWLLQNGRATEAVELLKDAAKQNGVTISWSTISKLDKICQDEDLNNAKKCKDNGSNPGSLQLLRLCKSSPGIRTILIVNSSIWFFLRALYVGIVINANNFTSSNPFEYVAFSGAMGVVAMFLTVPLSLRLPRKVFLGATLSMSGLLMLFEPTVPPALWWVKWMMVLMSFCLVCGAFQINYAYSAELLPTVIRARGIAITNLIGSIGEMIAPIVTDVVVDYQWWAASVIFGLSGIISGLLLPLMPETKGTAMPETLQDVEDRYHSSAKTNKSQNVSDDEIKETTQLPI